MPSVSRPSGVLNPVAALNVRESGLPAGPPMLFAHGFGCDQSMWRFVAPAFEATHRVVLFDNVGLGGSDPAAYDPRRHAKLGGYAEDILSICDALDLQDVVFVGHSVSSMIGLLASNRRPELFSKMVLIGPSPRYVDDEDYVGGFSREDIDDLLQTLESNHLGWAAAMAPVIMGNPDRPELATELEGSFCSADPDIALRFARATFLADNRADLAQVRPPCLVLQCADDPIAPEVVGAYVAEAIPHAELHRMEATGHCPNLSAPDETIRAIEAFL